MKNRANTHDTQMRTHGIYYMYSCEQICVGCRCQAKFIGARLRTFLLCSCNICIQRMYIWKMGTVWMQNMPKLRFTDTSVAILLGSSARRPLANCPAHRLRRRGGEHSEVDFLGVHGAREEAVETGWKSPHLILRIHLQNSYAQTTVKTCSIDLIWN